MSKLILVRHGQSIWNLENRFTGWVDISLSDKGIKEAKSAGRILSKFKFDKIYTSKLLRAQQTLFEILNLNDNIEKYLVEHNESKNYNKFTIRKEDKNLMIVKNSESLNERHYGDLQGLNKNETAKKFGDEQVKIWRRSYDVAPPNGESLKDTSKRTLPYFKKNILKDLKEGKNVLVAAHGNSLRAIIKFIESMTPKEILEFELKTGVPYVYTFDKNMKIKKKEFL